MKDEGKKRLLDFLAFILHPSAFIHVFLLRPRTYPQHMPSLLPLLRSRPGGVHKTSIVRSPGSDESLKHCQLQIANCRLVGSGLRSYCPNPSGALAPATQVKLKALRKTKFGDYSRLASEIKTQTAVLRCANMRSNPLIPRCSRM